MFSESRVREKLIAISDRTGWVPEYHSLSAIEAFNAHFDALADKAEREEGRREYVQDRLGYDELKWIQRVQIVRMRLPILVRKLRLYQCQWAD